MISMPKIYVILVEPIYPGNIGFIARVMKNFGFKNLIVINPKVNLSSKECRIFASHASDILENAIILNSLNECCSKMDFLVGTTSKIGGDYNILRIPVSPRDLAYLLSEVDGDVGIIFGRETYGLSNEELELCDVIVTIPASAEYPVLNVSHAAAIILYELFLILNRPFFKGFREASRIEKNILINCFNELVNLIDYPVFRKEIAKVIFKHVIGRAFISGREAYTLIGIFKKLIKELKPSNLMEF